jgi:hypothetical protein
VQRETYIRANYNKKKIKQPDFPVEAPESNSYKYEAGNAEHSLQDLSSESSKECSLTEFNEPCDRAKNYGGTKQAERHSAPEVFPRYCCHMISRLFMIEFPFSFSQWFTQFFASVVLRGLAPPSTFTMTASNARIAALTLIML